MGVVAGGFEDCFGGFAVLPGEVDLEAASGAQASEGSGGPCCGEGGEEADHVEVLVGAIGVGLEEHLDEAGGAAEVAVDLEGGVLLETADVEEVGAGGLAEELEDTLVSGVAVFEAGHAVDDPGAGPAGAAPASGQAIVERCPAGVCEVGRVARGDLVVGEEGEEVGDVAVTGLVLDVVLGPLLQVAGFTDLEGRELGEGGTGAGV